MTTIIGKITNSQDLYVAVLYMYLLTDKVEPFYKRE